MSSSSTLRLPASHAARSAPLCRSRPALNACPQVNEEISKHLQQIKLMVNGESGGDSLFILISPSPLPHLPPCPQPSPSPNSSPSSPKRHTAPTSSSSSSSTSPASTSRPVRTSPT